MIRELSRSTNLAEDISHAGSLIVPIMEYPVLRRFHFSSIFFGGTRTSNRDDSLDGLDPSIQRNTQSLQ